LAATGLSNILSDHTTAEALKLGYHSLILSPYVQADHSWLRRNSGWLSITAVLFLSAAYGCFVGLFLQTLVAACFVLPALLLVVVLWTMPATDRVPERLLEFLFFAFLVVLIVWPNYLALSLPGLPWITLIRLIGFPLAAVLIFCCFASKKFRTTIRAPLAASPLITGPFVAFLVFEVLAVIVSQEPAQSLSKLIIVQITWTAIFFSGCYIFAKPGRATLWAALICSTAVFVALIGLREHSQGQVLWAGHIPAFLKVGDEVVRRILTPHYREYTGRYRTLSTFSTPLGFAEFLALALPFVLHFAAEAQRPAIRVAAILTIPFLIYVVLLTDSRLGMVGCFMALLLYGLIWSIRRWRSRPKSIFGPAVAIAYPLIIVGVVGLTFVSHRVHAVVWGGDATEQGSTDVRREQMTLAIPKVVSRPWGYGMNMAADTVGYRTPGGILTLDSYYLTIVLEYGVLGFIVFYGMFCAAVFAASRALLSRTKVDPEVALLVPAALALANFIIMKSVFSQDDNHPVVFMLLAMVVILVWRTRSVSGASVSNCGSHPLLSSG
jgi:hypothetical protein